MARNTAGRATEATKRTTGTKEETRNTGMGRDRSMNRIVRWVVGAGVLAWFACDVATLGGADRTPVAAGKKALKIHMISGSKEYKSAESLPAFKDYLEKNYDIQCTISLAQDGGTTVPDLDKLDGADVLLIFCKRMKLPPDQMEKIKAWFKASKPAIGVRTASHAFQPWLEMDKEIFGGSYDMHGSAETVDVKIEDKNRDHAILKGVTAWTRPGKLYRNKANAPDTITLLTGAGQTSKDAQPVAWARVYDKDKDARAFYTSMGFVHDFQNANFARIMVNAIHWVSKREAPEFKPLPEPGASKPTGEAAVPAK